MRPSEYANASNAQYLEELFDRYKQDPDSVPEQWRAFFAGFELASGKNELILSGEGAEQPIGVFDLVHSYRELGHYAANLDPLKLTERGEHPLLALSNFNITEDQLDRRVGSGGFSGQV